MNNKEFNKENFILGIAIGALIIIGLIYIPDLFDDTDIEIILGDDCMLASEIVTENSGYDPATDEVVIVSTVSFACVKDFGLEKEERLCLVGCVEKEYNSTELQRCTEECGIDFLVPSGEIQNGN